VVPYSIGVKREIGLAQAGKNKVDLCAALHRAAKKEKLKLATASDEKNLYVFRRKPKPTSPISSG
jgi:hypothetical protein